MAKRSGKKGGAGITEALWTGTAVFAATKAKSYTGFITSVVIYGAILLVVLAAASWVMKALGFQTKEGMANGAFGQCPNGGSATPQPDGSVKCTTGANNVDVTTSSGGAAPLA